MTPEQIAAYADAIVALIEQDIEIFSGLGGDIERANGLRHATSFSELHNYVDANEYVIEVGLPWATQADLDAAGVVTDEVSRRLSERQANRP